MSATDPAIAVETRRRRTFAIISHPDAGKTTLTEKLLLYGGAIHVAGAVKSRKAARAAASDWMSIEKERGISVSTSVMQFPFKGCAINLLDTPGHQDFSEDTYRTLSAVDSAVMLIDAAKGVETQTKKLFQVCRLRDMPIFTFVNKMDREAREPLDLMEEIEKLLGIHCAPVNWPIGMGKEFKGVLDLRTKEVILFEGGEKGSRQVDVERVPVDSARARERIGEKLYAQLQEDVELLGAAGNELDPEKVRVGKITPVFFGSAMNNFGVEPFLAEFIQMAPSPLPRKSDAGEVEPVDDRFSGFIFKIQANMDPNHRDRIAFMRIVSGKFYKGMPVFLVREGREIRLTKPLMFLAQERTNVEEAFPGDVVGLYDVGMFRIGDTLCTGKQFRFEGIPR
ncbi:MAG TPA: peptide chain release factor 3, partial [bacterium]|nr:peptide chain release factor 3 [bacterium]